MYTVRIILLNLLDMVSVLVGYCSVTGFLNLNGIHGGDNGCDNRFLGVTSNKQVTFPRRNSDHLSGSSGLSGKFNKPKAKLALCCRPNLCV